MTDVTDFGTVSDGDEWANGTGAAGGSARTVPELADAEPDAGTGGGRTVPELAEDAEGDADSDLTKPTEDAEPTGAETDADLDADLDPDLDLDLDPAARLHTALPPRLESWRRRSAAGAILTGIGLGLKAALEPERDEPSIVMQATGDPPTDLGVEAELGGILPADNVVRIRPWLLSQAGPDRLESGSGNTTPASAGNTTEASAQSTTQVAAPQPIGGDPADGTTDTP